MHQAVSNSFQLLEKTHLAATTNRSKRIRTVLTVACRQTISSKASAEAVGIHVNTDKGCALAIDKAARKALPEFEEGNTKLAIPLAEE